jgi:hypothetical protein
MRKIIIFLTFIFSGFAFADTYPAVDQYMFIYYGNYITYSYANDDSATCAQIISNGQPAWAGSGYPDATCKFNHTGGYVAQFPISSGKSTVCPGGGTLSNNQCINAPACSSGQVRNATTGVCENSVTCNYTPTLTTVGTTQTISWQTENTATNSCTDNSVSCQAPLVANVEQKRCDLLCTDGTTVDVSSGAQCPPPVCVGGQTLNTATNTCDEPVCSALQVLNPATHTCLDNAVCVGGQTQNTSTMPYSCDEPVCTGLQLLNSTTHMCEDPAPAECVGAQTLDTATNSCIDPVCPSGYHLNAGKVCENDGECPLFTTKTMVDGMLKCVTTPTATTTTTGTTETTVEVTPETTSSTNTTNSDGTTSTSTTTTSSTASTSVTNTTSTSTCDDCAKESTLREAVKKMDATAGTSTAGSSGAGMGTFQAQGKNTNPDLGKWYEPTEDTYESVIQSNVDSIKNSPIMSFGKEIFSVSIPSGSCPSWTFPAVMGMNEITVSPLCADFMDDLWPLVSAVVQGCAVFMAFRIALTGLD